MKPIIVHQCVIAAAVAAFIGGAVAPAQNLSAPATQPAFEPVAQDRGLAYTRSARRMTLPMISGGVAVFPGSRYGYVFGKKVRLDATDLVGGEAIVREGVVYVPESFAPLVRARPPVFDAAPEYLADRWVYSPVREPANVPASVRRTQAEGRTYVAFADLAAAGGLKVAAISSGVQLSSDDASALASITPAQADVLVTLFDTPEKLADPSLTARSIPLLARQGEFTKYVRVTPEQKAILEGPETVFPSVPESDFDLTGFDASRLGSKVPAPGVYPRILFSPEDVPVLASRIKASKYGQMSLLEQEVLFRKSWWDPTTSDGQIFRKLATGDLAGLKFPDSGPNINPGGIPHVFEGQKPGIYNSHVAYVPECLTAMALWCLLQDDEVLGRQVAAAIANFYKLREPYVDEWAAYSDTEFGGAARRPDGRVVDFSGAGGETHWRGMHGNVASMNVAFALDFAGKWMTADEKAVMHRVIAKATYGRRAYGQDGPLRLRDVNWVTWDLPQFLALTAIEGLPGFDPEAYTQGRRTVRAFLDFGIDRHGQMYESNGKSGGGLVFQILSMHAMARRGENLFGHPHLRRMLTAQALATFPNGELTVSGGTFSGTALAFTAVSQLRAFFPGDRAADYLMTLAMPGRPAMLQSAWEPPAGVSLEQFDSAAYRAKLEAKNGTNRLRLPSPTYPAFVRSVVYDTDWPSTRRQDVGLPLDWSDDVHGVFTSSSDPTETATWMSLLVRPNHYMGAGHHHSDAGMFQFAALGVNWVTEAPFNMTYDGKYHNQVIVDGESQPGQFPARAKYLGASLRPGGASASADLTYAYSYRWTTQPPQVWDDEMKKLPWELEPAPDILAIYAGTDRYKMRPWWPSYAYSNFIATSRAPFNPMKHVYRSVGLVRGERPYGLVVDDVKKDDQRRLYQWTAVLGPGVWKASVPGAPAGAAVLAFRPPDPKVKLDASKPAEAITPASGEPLLLVLPLPVGGESAPSVAVETLLGANDRQGKPTPYNRMSIDVRSTESRYRVLLVPFRAGEPVPQVNVDQARGTAVVHGTDTIEFSAVGERTRYRVVRAGQTVSESN